MSDTSLLIGSADEALIAEIVRREDSVEKSSFLPPLVDDAAGPERDTGQPVPGFPIKFTWQKGQLFKLFERQVELIAEDVTRALQSDRMVVYLSCPISSRGGGFAGTNIEIALHTQNRLQQEWGEDFWFLNPAQYQMESKAGTGLMLHHARQLNREGVFTFANDAALCSFVRTLKPEGGDYMRMWTRVLVEDDLATADPQAPGQSLFVGGRFAAFYFVGPSDASQFFRQSGTGSLTACVEQYFARKYATDHSFNTYYSPDEPPGGPKWRDLRAQFLRYYTARYGANYSLGSHDEWNIWLELNRRRAKVFEIGSQIAGYFEGRQIAPSASETAVSRGYAEPDQ